MSEHDRAARGQALLLQLRDRSEHDETGVSPEGLDEVLHVSRNDLQDLLQLLLRVGYIEGLPTASPRFRMTPGGLQAAASHQLVTAPAAPNPVMRIDFQQTVHGSAHTQVGDHNTMQVDHTAQPDSETLLRLVAALRLTVAALPRDERAEAISTVEHAEKAVREGNFDRLKRYVPALLDLGTKSVEFGSKAHEFLKAVGLVQP